MCHFPTSKTTKKFAPRSKKNWLVYETLRTASKTHSFITWTSELCTLILSSPIGCNHPPWYRKILVPLASIIPQEGIESLAFIILKTNPKVQQSNLSKVDFFRIVFYGGHSCYEISTNAFSEVVERVRAMSNSLCVYVPLFSNFGRCPEILTNFGKNVSEIGLILNLAPKLKNRFLVTQPL